VSDFIDTGPELGNKADEFNSRLHIKEICEACDIFLKEPEIDYKQGWAAIIEEMLHGLKGYNILLTSIISDYGQLDTQFMIAKGVRAAKVYHAIDVARIRSRSTCMGCGDFGFREIRGDKVLVMCRGCRAIMEAKGETGTWLDKY